jgi:hypothetical protein
MNVVVRKWQCLLPMIDPCNAATPGHPEPSERCRFLPIYISNRLPNTAVGRHFTAFRSSQAVKLERERASVVTAAFRSAPCNLFGGAVTRGAAAGAAGLPLQLRAQPGLPRLRQRPRRAERRQDLRPPHDEVLSRMIHILRIYSQ